MVSAVAARAYVTRARTGGPLEIELIGDGITVNDAHVGETYNLGVNMRNGGPLPVQLISAGFADADTALRLLPPLLAATCDGEHPYIGSGVGGDLTKSNPWLRPEPLDARLIEPTATRFCNFVLIRAVPDRQGAHTARGVEIRYRTAFATYVARADVTYTLEVNAVGPDPRANPAPTRP